MTPEDVSVSQIDVNAWLDTNGASPGTLEWIGSVVSDTVPPAFPWHMDVTSIALSGNTAEVCWLSFDSVAPGDIGVEGYFDFTDNSATGAPDEIDGEPIEAGNIIVSLTPGREREQSVRLGGRGG